MLFTSMMKLLGLLDPTLKINIDLLLACLLFSVKIGDHCYHGLCDMGASVSAIPHSLYKEIMHDIAPAEIEELMLQLSLPIEILFHQLGLLEMLKSCVGKLNILLIFLFLAPHKMTFVPLYLVDPS